MEKNYNRIPTSPPTITPLPCDRRDAPLWSIMIPVYNCSRFLPEVLKSVLIQDMGVNYMQIEVIDDASTDADVEGLVKKIGKGRILYYRQERNVGSLRNFETCINRAHGKLVHVLHGDDRLLNGFYRDLTKLFNDYPEAGAAFCNYNFIDEFGNIKKQALLEEYEEGILKNWLIRISELQKIQFACMVVKREVYEKLGGFFGMSYGEDWEMWVRIAKHYPVAFTPEILAEYRTHSSSLTSKNALEGNIYHDMCRVINIIQGHLPPEKRQKVLLKNKKHCSNYLIGTAINTYKITGNLESTKLMIIQSLRLHTDLYGLARIIKFVIKVVTKTKLKKKNKYDSKPLDTNNQTQSFLV